MKYYLLLFSTILCSPSAAFSQTVQPDDEAPAALIQTDIGSSDVDLLIAGTWEASLAASIGYALPGDGTPISSPYIAQFPGMVQGVLFDQKPDLLLSLWLNSSLFFETSIIEGYELNTIQLGYINRDEGFLRRVIVGNSGLVFPQYGSVVHPESTRGSIGVVVGMESDISRHDALIRLDDLHTKQATFVGENEVLEFQIHPGSYSGVRQFILPDEDIDYVEVFVENTPGGGGADLVAPDGRTYRGATDASYTSSIGNGILYFEERLFPRILVYYEKGGVPVGDTSLGKSALCGTVDEYPDPSENLVDFSFTPGTYMGISIDRYYEEIGGKSYLVLYEKGTFSPFEHQGIYNLSFVLPEELWRTETSLGGASRSAADVELKWTPLDQDTSAIRIYRNSSNMRDPRERYPLAGEFPQIYGPHGRKQSSDIDRQIFARVIDPVEVYQLDNPSPESVVVRRNGVIDEWFTLSDAGVLELSRPAFPEERIDVTYQSEAGTESGKNLTFFLGNEIAMQDGIKFYGAIDGIWNIVPGTFSTEPEQNPGHISLALGGRVESPAVSAGFDSSVSLRSTDTSGIFRIYGMEEQEISVQISESNILPSYPPNQVVGLDHLTAANRGALLYKDYYTYGTAGRTILNDYNWPLLPDTQVFPYEEGKQIGPYIASTAGEVSDATAMVVDYNLEGTDEWVGAQLSASKSGLPEDLSSFQGIQFYWKRETADQDVTIHFHLGTIGEDVDTDGLMDFEADESATGFFFNDESDGFAVRIGGRTGVPNYSVETEDANKNGMLDAEEPLQIVSKSFVSGSASYPGQSWIPVQILFT